MGERESLLGKHGYAYSTLDDVEQDAYLRLYEAIASRTRIRAADYPNLNKREVSRLLACIDMDHPELFWMDGYQNPFATANSLDEETIDDVVNSFMEGADYDGDGKVSFFERWLAGGRALMDASPTLEWAISDELRPSLLWTEGRVRAVQEQFDAYLRNCEEALPRYLDDYHVFRRVFEYVAHHTSYNLRQAQKSQDARSVFLKRESVCKGYAEALQYLLLSQGIPCFTVQGTADVSDEAQASHAWNYVLIDGQWNIVDVTVGDWDLELRPERMPSIPDGIRESFVDYRCMSLSGQGYHPADIVPLPDTANSGSYFEREGYYLQAGDWVRYAGVLLRLFNHTEPFVLVRCDGDFEQLHEWMSQSLSRVVKMCVAAGGSYESFMTDPDAFAAMADQVDAKDVRETGWQGFGLSLQFISPKRDVILVTAKRD